MTRILHIETATPVCSVAVTDDHELIWLKESHEPNSHSKILTAFIEQALKELSLQVEELDAIALSIGPGSYTGLRIGASTAKGLAYGGNIPIISINTLQSIAFRAIKEHGKNMDSSALLRPMLDARRMEVYTALYDQQGREQKVTVAQIIEESTFHDELAAAPIIFFGNGSAKCKPVINHPNAIYLPEIEASAQFMCEPALKKYSKNDFVDTAYFEPLYLKEFIATIPKNKMFPTKG